MLKITDVQTVDGVTVYNDERYDDVFYPMAEVPRFRLTDDGTYAFRFLKYRSPINRPDGKRGGGFVFFDTELTLSPAKLASVTEKLQSQVQAMSSGVGFRPSQPGQPKARIGTITYTRGTVDLLLKEDNGRLVEAVKSASTPSLFGRNIASFMVEFSPDGATLFEQALQGRGGVVQVVYNLEMMVKLPEMSGRAWFNANKFYSFQQTIDVDWKLYGEDDYVETLSESFVENETMGVELHLDAVHPDPEEDRKIKDKIRSQLERALQEAVVRKVIPEIEAVPMDERGLPEDIETLRRSLTTFRASSFEQTYRESSAVAWTIAPQGTMSNITNLVDGNGEPVKWGDYATVVDLNDPFFQQLHVNVGVNADFAELPIHSIEVKIDYDHGDQHQQAEYSFTDADTVHTFKTFIANDRRDYVYSYQVNYVGSSRTLQSPLKTSDDQVLTVNVDDLGLLDLVVDVGDIDFTQVASAQVTVRYQDTGVDRFEEQFSLSQAKNKHRVLHVLHQPRRRPVDYRVDYFMVDGRHIAEGWQSTDRHHLLINDPLGQSQRFEVRAVGDFVTRIERIFLDLVYNDQSNDYVLRRSYALNVGNEMVSESFPVLGAGRGTISYSGQIRYKDGTVKVIPETVAEGTIIVGDVVSSKLAVTVIPLLLDWAAVRLARVALRHGEGPGAVEADLIFSSASVSNQTWEVPLAEEGDRTYRWQASYFLADGSQHTTEWMAGTDPSIILQAPAAAIGPTTPTPPGAGLPPSTPGPGPTPLPGPVPNPTPSRSTTSTLAPTGGASDPGTTPGGTTTPPAPPAPGGTPPQPGSTPPPPPPMPGTPGRG